MQRRQNRSHMCCWHETNQYLVSKQDRKQITRKQITGVMTCSKIAAKTLGLNKQDTTNGTCVAVVEQVIIWLAQQQHTKQNSWNNELFTVNSQCIRIMQRHRWCMLMTPGRSFCSRNIILFQQTVLRNIK